MILMVVVIMIMVIPACNVRQKCILLWVVKTALDVAGGVVELKRQNSHSASQPTSQVVAGALNVPWLLLIEIGAGGEEGGGGGERGKGEDKEEMEGGD